MSYKPKGKHVIIDENNPQALGVCDLTGFTFLRKDLVREMEWRGNDLVWTGFMVGRPYVSKPNPQLKTPVLAPDPVPIDIPRVPQTTTVTWSQGLGGPWNQLNVYPWGCWGTIYDGVPALSEPQRLQVLQNFNWSSGG